MRSYYAKDIERAIEVYSRLRPGSSQMAARRYARKAGSHLATDYRDSKGLRILGVDVAEARPYIEFQVTDEDTLEIEWMVYVVDSSGSGEVFDTHEVLGYDTFIKAAPMRKELDAAAKSESLERKGAESYEPEQQ